MKQIKIFIASSSELKRERMELVDLMQDLNLEIKEKSIQFYSILWEYMDSSMRAARKEDEYLEELRESEICIVLFWQTLGEYTVEELNVAVDEMKTGRLPKKVYVFYKEPTENITEELVRFKEKFIEQYELYPNSFDNAQTLRKQTENILKQYINFKDRTANE